MPVYTWSGLDRRGQSRSGGWLVDLADLPGKIEALYAAGFRMATVRAQDPARVAGAVERTVGGRGRRTWWSETQLPPPPGPGQDGGGSSLSRHHLTR